MRSFVLSAALLFVAATIPVAAHADTTFTYTPTDGDAAITFSLSGAPQSSSSAPFEFNTYSATAANGDSLYINFFGDAYNQYYTQYEDPSIVEAGYLPYGAFNFYLYDDATETEYFTDGPQLYSGSSSDPTFLSGTYQLTGDPDYGSDGQPGYDAASGGTLLIGGVGAAPEPSSLILLGTGMLSAAAATRRKLRNS